MNVTGYQQIMSENSYKVRLIPIASLIDENDLDAIRNSQVRFESTPTFSESGSVEYTPISPVHLPGSIQVYKFTNARQFEIGAKFISRNTSDALKNMRYLQLLRSWRYPYFGMTDTLSDANKQSRADTQQRRADQIGEPTSNLTDREREQNTIHRVQSEGVQLKGAPPDILYLYAYNNDAIDQRNNTAGVYTPVNINRIPVVVTNLVITYPDDVDYIPVYDPSSRGPDNTFTQVWPVRIDVNLTLAETHSPAEFENFDLNAYKNGNLANF